MDSWENYGKKRVFFAQVTKFVSVSTVVNWPLLWRQEEFSLRRQKSETRRVFFTAIQETHLLKSTILLCSLLLFSPIDPDEKCSCELFQASFEHIHLVQDFFDLNAFQG